MKFEIVAGIITTVLVLVCLGCLFLALYPSITQYVTGNKQFFDFNGSFNKAIVYVGNEKLEIEIKKWTDYDGEQIQIIDKDGKVYLVSSFNTVLVKE